MKPWLRYGTVNVLYYVFALTLSLPAISAQTNPVKETNYGKIMGVVDGNSAHFRGIPYAKPPVGQWRWQPPRPHKPWSQTRDASQFGPPCPQARNISATSEDCLTLNISTPVSAHRNSRLPVLMWIHGGGFVGGSGSSSTYDSRLWNANGIVLVTINYRLGALGFFAHPNLDSRFGVNYGLMDMIAALQWIKENISAFGGDPQQVAIGGISAGGMAVQLLMASPMSKGLFHAAISQSGYGTWPLLRNRSDSLLAEAERQSQQIATRALGKTGDGISKEDLYNATTEQLVNGIRGFHLPIIDGVSLPDEPAIVFSRGAQHAVPFLSGANGFDGSIYPYSSISPKTLHSMTARSWEKITQLYNIGDTAQNSLGISQLFGDLRYLLAARYSTAQMHNVQQPGYRYFFNYVPVDKKQDWPGAPHGSEGKLLFADDVTPIARIMRQYWSNFIKSGNPNSKGLKYWPPVTADNQSWMVFRDNPTVETEVRTEKLDTLEATYLQRVSDLAK